MEEVDLAGDKLLVGEGSATTEVLDVVDNWRSCHAFPLNTFQMSLRRKSAELSGSTLIAQRVKRLPAIVHKLKRLSRLKLSQLQDIGGCRAVFKNVAQVREIRAALASSKMRHPVLREDDYIAKPKSSGYRSLHVVFEYRSDRSKDFNGRKIEMQLRTRLQHAWATAVETVGMFSSQYLKSSQGNPKWLRFFALMGSVLSLREKGREVPGTPTGLGELKKELRSIAREVDARKRLVAYGQALQVVESQISNATKGGLFLLELQPEAETLRITGYKRKERSQAEADYLEVERANLAKKPSSEVVLVAVQSVAALRTAYPNYYLDTRRFVTALDEAIGSS